MKFELNQRLPAVTVYLSRPSRPSALGAAPRAGTKRLEPRSRSGQFHRLGQHCARSLYQCILINLMRDLRVVAAMAETHQHGWNRRTGRAATERRRRSTTAACDALCSSGVTCSESAAEATLLSLLSPRSPTSIHITALGWTISTRMSWRMAASRSSRGVSCVACPVLDRRITLRAAAVASRAGAHSKRCSS